MFNRLLIGILFLATGSVSGFARSPLDLQSFFDQQLAAPSPEFCTSAGVVPEVGGASRFFFNVSPSVSVGIHGLVELTVTPEIEWVWTRSPGSD